ncbi:MAG: class I SAM-dependent methyltransferase [Actinobacteria bacterium]|nr:class I SAM-dependent methyltransferase [Actinomycetota bacterium]
MPEVPPLTPLATAALHVGDPERILQVECGDGDGALFLAREFPRASVRGVDADEAAIRRAAGRVGLDPEGRVAFKAGGPRKLPFPDDLFDLVALLDAKPVPRELARVLRPGGYLILARSAGGPEQSAAARLRSWRLRRRGIEPIWAEIVGDGGYAVGRLRGGGPPTAGE